MNHSVTKLDGSQVKLTLTVTPEQFEEAIQTVYNKAKKNIQLPGFRKGKAPRKMIERAYGKEVFYEDALNDFRWRDCGKQYEIVPVRLEALED